MKTPPEERPQRASEEPELLEQVRAGSADAFAVVVQAYSERLYAVVLRIVHDPADAEEVVQETFLKAYRNLARFQGDSALYTWLYRIAVNAAVDHAKKQRRRRHLSLDDEDSGHEPALPVAESAPEARSEKEELVALVQEGIEALPDPYRVILVLREYSEMSYEQLGEVLELPKGTVESRLFRARHKLKDWLQRRLELQGLQLDALGL